ncbi:MAG TPA: HNH endonuclease [Methanocorpusculum sp.]|nr:HNH endonuclease [Methanocorpusculum sp.]
MTETNAVIPAETPHAAHIVSAIPLTTTDHVKGTFPFAFPDFVASQKILREEWIVDTKTGKIYYPTGKEIPAHMNNAGYLKIRTVFENVKLGIFVHRAVMIAERRGRTIPRLFTINHINENKTDNRVENLELKTITENIQMYYLSGGRETGSPIRSLKNEDVRRIRRECKNLDKKAHAQKIAAFAEEFNVTKSTIRSAARGASYAHIKEPEVKTV